MSDRCPLSVPLVCTLLACHIAARAITTPDVYHPPYIPRIDVARLARDLSDGDVAKRLAATRGLSRAKNPLDILPAAEALARALGHDPSAAVRVAAAAAIHRISSGAKGFGPGGTD
ncbi:unnamed protein product, partial [marine sediment metagenome]